MGRETIKTARPWTRLGPGFTLKSAQPAASQAKAADAGRSRLKPWSRGRGGTGSGILVMIALALRSEEHTSELQSLMRISYAVFCLKKTKTKHEHITQLITTQSTTICKIANINT